MTAQKKTRGELAAGLALVRPKEETEPSLLAFQLCRICHGCVVGNLRELESGDS
jgi:hypothetical protein